MDGPNATSLIVSVSRTAFPLSARRDQLVACPWFTALVGDAASTVTVTMLAPPPVDGADSYAVDQTMTSDISGSAARSLTLVAQIDGLRVSSTFLHNEASGTTTFARSDTEALDTVFTEAVLKVQRNGRP